MRRRRTVRGGDLIQIGLHGRQRPFLRRPFLRHPVCLAVQPKPRRKGKGKGIGGKAQPGHSATSGKADCTGLDAGAMNRSGCRAASSTRRQAMAKYSGSNSIPVP